MKYLSVKMCDEKLNELRTKKNGIVENMEQRKADFDNADVEARESILKEVESMKGECDSIDAEIKDCEEQRAKLAEQDNRFSLVANVQRETIIDRSKTEDSEEYRSAYANAIKGNDRQLRALTTSTDNVPIPTIIADGVETAWAKYGKFSRIVKKSYVKGLFAVPYESTADGANWHDEGGAEPTEESLTLGQVILQPRMIKKWISLTDELKAMAPDEFLRYITDELVYRVVKLLDDEIIAGEGKTVTNGKAGVVGVLNSALTTKATAAALTFNTGNVLAAEIISDLSDITIVMNKKTFLVNVMAMTDTTGKPIFNIIGENEKARYYYNGLRVEFTDALPAYDSAKAGEVYMIAGDFNGYRLNLPEGESVQFVHDIYTKATEDTERVVARLFAAGNVTKLQHFASIAKPTA